MTYNQDAFVLPPIATAIIPKREYDRLKKIEKAARNHVEFATKPHTAYPHYDDCQKNRGMRDNPVCDCGYDELEESVKG